MRRLEARKKTALPHCSYKRLTGHGLGDGGRIKDCKGVSSGALEDPEEPSGMQNAHMRVGMLKVEENN